MQIYFIFTALILSFVLEFSYFYFIKYLRKKTDKMKFKITNTFLYEVTPKFYESTKFINGILFFAVTVNLFPFIYYLVYNLSAFTVTIMIIAFLLIFVLSFLPFIGLEKLREHLYLDVAAIMLLGALVGMESYYSFHLYRYYYDNQCQLAAAIIGLVIFVFILVIAFNPKLFDLKNKINDKGEPERKKIVWLAFSEWLLYPLTILSLIPLLLLCVK